MKRDYVLIMKVRNLTQKQAFQVGMRAVTKAKEIAPGRRDILAITQKGEQDAD